VQLDERRLDRIDVVRRDDHPAPGLANQLGGGAVGWDDGQDRASGAMYSNTFPERTPFPRPPASGTSRSSASESRW
jgi:hypothetical protein